MGLFSVAAELLLMCLVGFIARRSDLVGDDFGDSLSGLLIDVIIPCYVFHALSTDSTLSGTIGSGGELLATAVITMTALFIVGTVVYFLLGKTGRGRILRFGTMFTNTLVFGLPVAEACWGIQGFVSLMVFYIPIRIGYYCFSAALLCPDGGKDLKSLKTSLAKALFSPSVIACALGFVFSFSQIRLPSVLLNVLSGIGICCKPLGMMLVGIIIAGYDLKTVCSRSAILMALYKLLVLPALSLGAVCLLGVDGISGRLVVLFTALPSGPLLTTFCLRYIPDRDTQLESAGLVLLSTAGAVITVTGWIRIIDLLVPL